MGKTYRNYPKDSGYLRNPKGRKQALINKARNKAVPPDPWDLWEERPPSAETFIPFHAAIRMVDAGMPDAVIIKKIRNKFKYNQRQAEEVLEAAKR